MLTTVKDAAAARRAVLAAAKERGVRWVRLAFVDVLGIEKSVSVPVSELERALAGNVTFDGGSIDGFVRGEEVDMVLRPDPATFTVLPWSSDGQVEARVLCDIETPDGTPFEGDPRSTLKRVLEDAGDVLQTLRAGLEVEFYLFALAPDGTPSTRTTDAGSYFDFSASDRGEEVRLATSVALEAMGIPISSAHHEHGAGQHELDLAAGSVLAMADRLVTVRGVVKRIAERHGLHATFMPKPLEDQAGSGLHVYFALGAVDEVVRLHAVAGLLEHAPGFTAICNPTVNSYKRLVAAWDAPVYTVWSRAQRERAGARAAAGRQRSAAARSAQPRRVVQPVSRDGGARRSARRRHPHARPCPATRSPARRTSWANASAPSTASASCRARCARRSRRSTTTS